MLSATSAVKLTRPAGTTSKEKLPSGRVLVSCDPPPVPPTESRTCEAGKRPAARSSSLAGTIRPVTEPASRSATSISTLCPSPSSAAELEPARKPRSLRLAVTVTRPSGTPFTSYPPEPSVSVVDW